MGMCTDLMNLGDFGEDFGEEGGRSESERLEVVDADGEGEAIGVDVEAEATGKGGGTGADVDATVESRMRDCVVVFVSLPWLS